VSTLFWLRSCYHTYIYIYIYIYIIVHDLPALLLWSTDGSRSTFWPPLLFGFYSFVCSDFRITNSKGKKKNKKQNLTQLNWHKDMKIKRVSAVRDVWETSLHTFYVFKTWHLLKTSSSSSQNYYHRTLTTCHESQCHESGGEAAGCLLTQSWSTSSAAVSEVLTE